MNFRVSKPIDQEIRRILREMVKGDQLIFTITGGGSQTTRLAVWHLFDIGAFADKDGGFRLTAKGREVERDMGKPDWWLWIKRNWFPVGVLAVSAVSSVAAIMVAL